MYYSSSNHKAHKAHKSVRGFTLLEVLITIVVSAVALLGLAKMQALAVSSTSNAGSRSLIALQVASLVSSMHVNTAYWAPSTAVVNASTFSAAGTTVTDPTGVLNAASSGCATQCTPAALAAYDVQTWVAGMNQQFPTYTANVNCTGNAAQPVSCQIYVTWVENQVAMNQTTAATAPGGSATATQSFSVFVQP
ncbi:prepilin-type N-terminal cleavage/methylation domain-containing protein [Glaciimonas soli]|uniref:Prepilin-type N-terminal cleavage/methylation domain-containing protein n=1 Tax=Glaciimonas soli TaxID=2590999 RepID=A0A843YJ41_9BURK|nr:prepilin-type N-terminal cleavage/methylation domain-containing protein [Glaciimonas soli]MQQ99798.1 prepilin-type N-terminal cleavage/methylation domain-containing protein [Glaciimonas soli]